jgi:aminoglycoside phosphotransferase (APT) family kinase protein
MMSADPGLLTVNTADLRVGLQAVLYDFGLHRPIEQLVRRPSPYHSSHVLEEVDVRLDDGTALLLVFKNLNPHALLPEAQQVRPDFLQDPLREIETYRTLLSPDGFSTALCYGASVDAQAGRYWLFLERVQGAALWQIGDFERWQQAARWLAAFHSHFAATPVLAQRARAAHLLHYDEGYYQRWRQRAHTLLAPGAVSGATVVWLLQRYVQAIEILLALPPTVIHGEFYPANILIREDTNGEPVCPIDWEVTAVAPGLIDLAALVDGKWSEAEREALSLAYKDACTTPTWDTETTFSQALDCCRLHLAIQWLAWANNWSPPPEHQQNWLDQALQLAERLTL